MTDDRAKFAHATTPGGHWYPCPAESEEAAARDAAYEWLHEVTEDGRLTVLVGRTDWQGPEEIASLANYAQIIEYVDERIWEKGEHMPLLREETTAEERAKLDAKLVDILADWIEEIDYPGFFMVRDYSEWRVTTLPDEEGGPKVEKIEKRGGRHLMS